MTCQAPSFNTESKFAIDEPYPTAMAGGTKQHNRLVKNIGSLLDGFLESGCEACNENVKPEVVPGGYYVYPDVVLTCDPYRITFS